MKTFLSFSPQFVIYLWLYLLNAFAEDEFKILWSQNWSMLLLLLTADIYWRRTICLFYVIPEAADN